MFYANAKAQSLTEYLIVIVLVITAISVMQFYMKRGLQATIKVAADELAPQVNSEPAVDIAKGGFLWKADSSTNMHRATNEKEFIDGGKNYTVDEWTNTTSNGVYSQGKLVGDFNRE